MRIITKDEAMDIANAASRLKIGSDNKRNETEYYTICEGEDNDSNNLAVTISKWDANYGIYCSPVYTDGWIESTNTLDVKELAEKLVLIATRYARNMAT